MFVLIILINIWIFKVVHSFHPTDLVSAVNKNLKMYAGSIHPTNLVLQSPKAIVEQNDRVK